MLKEDKDVCKRNKKKERNIHENQAANFQKQKQEENENKTRTYTIFVAYRRCLATEIVGRGVSTFHRVGVSGGDMSNWGKPNYKEKKRERKKKVERKSESWRKGNNII